MDKKSIKRHTWDEERTRPRHSLTSRQTHSNSRQSGEYGPLRMGESTNVPSKYARRKTDWIMIRNGSSCSGMEIE